MGKYCQSCSQRNPDSLFYRVSDVQFFLPFCFLDRGHVWQELDSSQICDVSQKPNDRLLQVDLGRCCTDATTEFRKFVLNPIFHSGNQSSNFLDRQAKLDSNRHELLKPQTPFAPVCAPEDPGGSVSLQNACKIFGA